MSTLVGENVMKRERKSKIQIVIFFFRDDTLMYSVSFILIITMLYLLVLKQGKGKVKWVYVIVNLKLDDASSSAYVFDRLKTRTLLSCSC